jgi:hypothetical protein
VVNFSTDLVQPQSAAVSAYGELAIMNFSTTLELYSSPYTPTSPMTIGGIEGDSDVQALAFANPTLTLTQL